MNKQTTHIALIKIALKEKHLSDGMVELIDDLAFENNAEHDGYRLAYTMQDSSRDELRERVTVFNEALRKFFRSLEIRFSAFNITVTYREEPARSVQEGA